MQQSAYHICIICSRLDLPGGIERAVVNTANLLQENGNTVTLLIADVVSTSFYPLNAEIKMVQAPLHFGITNTGNIVTRKLHFFRHISALAKIFKTIKPDAIVGTEYSFSIAACMVAKRTGIAVFAWEHHHFHWLKKSRFWNFLFKKYYQRLNAVICLNETEQKLFNEAGCNAAVIPNFISRQNRASLTSKTILSIGWLIKRKGFDLVPAIAEKVFAIHPGWRWIIIGAGEEEKAIKSELQKRNLSQQVIIVSPTSPDIENYYLDSSLYVMTSRFECFPMVLLEAMAHGLPAISFDCPTGPSFIISDNVDGLLVNEGDVDEMAKAILNLVEDENKRLEFGAKAFKNVNRFSPDKVHELWRKLFAEYCSEP